MNTIDQLRQRQADEQAKGDEAFWSLAAEIASGKNVTVTAAEKRLGAHTAEELDAAVDALKRLNAAHERAAEFDAEELQGKLAEAAENRAAVYAETKRMVEVELPRREREAEDAVRAIERLLAARNRAVSEVASLERAIRGMKGEPMPERPAPPEPSATVTYTPARRESPKGYDPYSEHWEKRLGRDGFVHYYHKGRLVG